MRDKIVPAMAKLRELGDQIEVLTPHEIWPLPTYREMLFVKSRPSGLRPSGRQCRKGRPAPALSFVWQRSATPADVDLADASPACATDEIVQTVPSLQSVIRTRRRESVTDWV